MLPILKKKVCGVALSVGENVIPVPAFYLLKEAETLNYCWWLKEAYSQAWTKGPRCFNRNSLCVNQMSDPTEQLHLQPDLWKISTASIPMHWASCVSNTHFCTVSSTNKGLASTFTTWKLTDQILSRTQVNRHWFFKTKIQRHSGWTAAKWECWYCLLSIGPGCSSLYTFLTPDCTHTSDVCTTFGLRDTKLEIYKS